MNNIAITGLKGSGKTLISTYFTARGFTKVSLADPLKNMLKVLGCTDEQLWGDEKEIPSDILCGHTTRFAMQTLGNEWGRFTIGEQLWANAFERNVKDKLPFVCDDVRMPTDCDIVRKLGAKIIRVVRPGLVSDGHSSEQHINNLNVDFEIVNDGSIEDLIANVAMINRLVHV